MSDLAGIIRSRIEELSEEAYADFQSKLMPGISRESIIGVRTPILKKLAAETAKLYKSELGDFFEDLPHKYYEENNLHMFLLEYIKNYDEYVTKLWDFLPYVDNWATCDQGASKILKANKEIYINEVFKMLESKRTYTIRFGIGSLMRYYLDESFDSNYLELVSKIESDEYYVNMMIAWYFATALSKQWESTIPYLEEHKLSKWVHQKTIQKAVESYRITQEQKLYLKALRIK